MSSELPQEDVDFLQKLKVVYEFHAHGAVLHLIIKSFPLEPARYSAAAADLLIEIPPGYPTAQLDMFWMSPRVTYADGTLPQATDVSTEYHGRSWQRWSRHNAQPWRPGIDNLRSFFGAIRKELQGDQS